LSSEIIQFTVLNLLYDRFETRQRAWVRLYELLNSEELNYLDENLVATEIDFLAEKTILTGASGDGQPPFTEVKINGTGLHIVRFVSREFPKYLSEIENEECKLKFKQISAMQNEKERRMEILSFIKEKPNYFEDFVQKTDALSLNPIYYYASRQQVGSTFNMYGDIFQNIHGSTIVNKSSLENAFNTLHPDQETSEALIMVAEFISNSGNHAAGALYNAFTDELTKSTPEKPRLKGIWKGIEAILPAVTSVAGVVTKIIPLLS